MRTKVMFFVATGSVPAIFAEQSIPPSWFKRFDLTKRHQAASSWTSSAAPSTGRLAQLPNADAVYAMLKQRPDKAGVKKKRRGIGAKLLRFLRRKTGR
jgi:hypothetical protein